MTSSVTTKYHQQVVHDLEHRIRELEAELQEQARIVGMGAEREIALRAENERLWRLLRESRIQRERQSVRTAIDATMGEVMGEQCLHQKTKLVDSRIADGVRKRRRECLVCGERFTTVEVPIECAPGMRWAASAAAAYLDLPADRMSALRYAIQGQIVDGLRHEGGALMDAAAAEARDCEKTLVRNNFNGKNGNGYQPLPDTSGKQPLPPMGDVHKCPIVDGLRYEGGALMDAAANEIEILRKTCAEARDDAEKYYQLWQSVITYHEDKTVKERDRLLSLATKYCPRDSYDWQEIMRIAGDADSKQTHIMPMARNT